MQFGTRQLFAFVSVTGFLFGMLAWLYSMNRDMSLDWVAPLFIPSIPVMGFCLALLPFVCLPLFLTLVVLISVNPPRPYLAIVFLGLQLAIFFVDISYWSNGVRFVAAMLAAAIALTIEIYWRKLPRVYRIFAALAFVLTIAWYVVAIGVAASAAV